MTPDTQVNPTLSTARLTLEPQTASHVDVMLRVLADPRTHAFIPSEPPIDRVVLEQRYARLESRRSPDGCELWLNWVVVRHGEAIGTVQASVNLAETRADVAYVFHPNAWGQGYASEALSALMEFLWQDLAVQIFRANIDTRNVASQHLVENLGSLELRRLREQMNSRGPSATNSSMSYGLDNEDLSLGLPQRPTDHVGRSVLFTSAAH